MSPRVTGSRAVHAAEMRRIVGSFESTDLSQAEFCRIRGIPLSTFTYWRRRMRSVGRPSPFVEVDVVRVGVGGRIEISLPGGLTAMIGSDASEDFIRRLIRAAGSAC